MPERLHIAVDVREACRPVRAGKAQWTHGFVDELSARDVRLTLLTDTAVPARWSGVESWVLPRGGFRWHWSMAQRLRRSPDIDLFLSPTSYLIPVLLGRAKPCMPVVHDLIAFRGEPHDRRAQTIERLTLGRAVAGAAHILTVSGSTRDDLLQRYPSLPGERVTAVFAGPMRAEARQSAGAEKLILCIATLCPRKNQERLLKAFSSLTDAERGGYRLLLVGARGWDDDGIVRLAAETPGAEWRDYVPDGEYERLLDRAALFALPSLYEGFGMQILDALQRGMPVLTSDRGSLREVAGDAACIVDPESVESIAAGLRRLISDEAYRDGLRSKGPAQAARFSWKHSVDLFLEAAGRVL
jgi:glycosyltransferase involved in cell wall biosynthesis